MCLVFIRIYWLNPISNTTYKDILIVLFSETNLLTAKALLRSLVCLLFLSCVFLKEPLRPLNKVVF